MPPWKPVEGAAFHNERKLTDQEIDTLAAWVDGGTPEGDPKDARRPGEFTDGWQLGKPDLVLTVPEEMHPRRRAARNVPLLRAADRPDGGQVRRRRRGAARQPAGRASHPATSSTRPAQARKLEQKEKDRTKKDDEQDNGPGYSRGDGRRLHRRGHGLGGWAPGQMARYLPEGTGYFLPERVRHGRCRSTTTATAGSRRIELQIGLYFAKKTDREPYQTRSSPAVRRPPGTAVLVIPAERSELQVNGGIEVSQDCDLHSVMPHMHLLGKKIKVTMTPPDRSPDDAGSDQGVGLQLAGNLLPQGADRRQGGHDLRGGGCLRQQRQEPEQPVQPADER